MINFINMEKIFSKKPEDEEYMAEFVWGFFGQYYGKDIFGGCIDKNIEEIIFRAQKKPEE